MTKHEKQWLPIEINEQIYKSNAFSIVMKAMKVQWSSRKDKGSE